MGVPPYYFDPYHSALGAAYVGKKIYDWYLPGGKMPRPLRQIPYGPRKRRRGGGGPIPGVFDGKFKGPVDRSKHKVLRSGYSESHVQSGTTTLDGCCYLGMASYSAFQTGTADGAADYGRVFQDIWIAILRKWFRFYHPGRLEFATPDQSLNELLDWSTSYNNVLEFIRVRYTKPDGTNTAVGTSFTYWDQNGSAAYDNLRTLANALASEVMTQWKDNGRVPNVLTGMRRETVQSTAPDQYVYLATGQMNLSQMKVRANCVNIMAVQNQTIADDSAEGNGFRNSMMDISCNPLRGKLFYFRGLGPVYNAGFSLGADGDNTTVEGDEWAAKHLSKPSVTNGNLVNIYSPTNDPTGCWQMVPNRQYFKNCVRAINVTLDPGHIKTFKISFRFKGSLWNFIKGEQVVMDDTEVFENGDVDAELKSAGLAKGMGTSVILAMEKRIRGGTEGVQLQWQATTHITTDCYVGSKQVMTKDVFISATEDPVV